MIINIIVEYIAPVEARRTLTLTRRLASGNEHVILTSVHGWTLLADK